MTIGDQCGQTAILKTHVNKQELFTHQNVFENSFDDKTALKNFGFYSGK